MGVIFSRNTAAPPAIGSPAPLQSMLSRLTRQRAMQKMLSRLSRPWKAYRNMLSRSFFRSGSAVNIPPFIQVLQMVDRLLSIPSPASRQDKSLELPLLIAFPLADSMEILPLLLLIFNLDSKILDLGCKKPRPCPTFRTKDECFPPFPYRVGGGG